MSVVTICLERKEDAQLASDDDNSSSPEDNNEKDDDEWVIQTLENKRMRDGKVQYLVGWAPTWVDEGRIPAGEMKDKIDGEFKKHGRGFRRIAIERPAKRSRTATDTNPPDEAAKLVTMSSSTATDTNPRHEGLELVQKGSPRSSDLEKRFLAIKGGVGKSRTEYHQHQASLALHYELTAKLGSCCRSKTCDEGMVNRWEKLRKMYDLLTDKLATEEWKARLPRSAVFAALGEPSGYDDSPTGKNMFWHDLKCIIDFEQSGTRTVNQNQERCVSFVKKGKTVSY
jgi:hypothetical protein